MGRSLPRKLRDRDQALELLLGSRNVIEFEAPGIVPQPIVVPPGVDPYWIDIGDTVGWRLLPRQEWPVREDGRPGLPDALLRAGRRTGWSDSRRMTWPKPAHTHEPWGLVPWEVLADIRFAARVASIFPEVFHFETSSDAKPATTQTRRLGAVAGAPALQRTAVTAEGGVAALARLLSVAGPSRRDQQPLRTAIRQLAAGIRTIRRIQDNAEIAIGDRLREWQSQLVTGTQLPPYPKGKRGRTPSPALVVHAAKTLLSWRRTAVTVRTSPRKTPTRGEVVVLGEVDASKHATEARRLAWIVAAALALEPEGWDWDGRTLLAKDGLSYWTGVTANYFREGKS